ncbi:hypothetical protein N7539_001735 [Penicillium diatomitis]|uniref:Uncharacterized protein n=1 Tax=Penicillium diatomitis TaxID=2819901 RepID=A0A9W9XHH4_9EURO|nr:uncharacterized protein N7539_001735 [Penicillium diatomitis]KAJ5492989.1 hypothetical protein N7539_001735 [Penicillium diatomitis]
MNYSPKNSATTTYKLCMLMKTILCYLPTQLMSIGYPSLGDLVVLTALDWNYFAKPEILEYVKLKTKS